MIRKLLRFFLGNRSLTHTYERRWYNLRTNRPGAF